MKAAEKALDTRNVDLVLIWVQAEDEAEILTAFNKTLTVRTLGQMAQELADHYFYETVVRLHRAGEGEPFTGLKPAGRDLGPAIPAADQAIDCVRCSQLRSYSRLCSQKDCAHISTKP